MALLLAPASVQLAEVEATGCWPPWLEPGELSELLAVEPAGPAVASIRLPSCLDDRSEVEVVVSNEQSDQRATERVDLRDVPTELRLRALALAIGEVATRLRSSSQPAPAPPSVAAPEGAPPALGLSLSGGGRAWLGYDTPTFGARVAGALLRPTPWFFEVGLGAEVGRSHHANGTIDIGLVALDLGAGARGHIGSFVWRVGPRLELGWAWARGTGSDAAVEASSVGDIVVSPAVLASGSVAVLRTWSLGLEVGGGFASSGVEASTVDEVVSGIHGPHLRAAFTISARSQ